MPPPPRVAIASPGITTAPRVTGTVSTRPSAGARTSPSEPCWRTHLPLRLGGGDLIAHDVGLGAQGIEPLGGGHAAVDELLAARQIGLGVLQLGLQRAQLGVEGIDLEDDLVVTDGADALTGGDRVAFGHLEGDEGAARAGTGWNRVAGLDRP